MKDCELLSYCKFRIAGRMQYFGWACCNKGNLKKYNTTEASVNLKHNKFQSNIC